MKKIAVLIFVLLFTPMAIACEATSYNVFYLPLKAEFYIPPTREYIMKHGINFELDSCVLTSLFKEISGQEGVVPQSEATKGLRILMVNKKDAKEVFITSDRQILYEGKKYNIDVEIVDDVIKEIIDFIKANKLE